MRAVVISTWNKHTVAGHLNYTTSQDALVLESPAAPSPEETLPFYFPPMHTIIHPLASSSRKRSAAPASSGTFRQPHYECEEQSDAMKLVVYLPGVNAAGVDIEGRGVDLVVTARKPHPI